MGDITSDDLCKKYIGEFGELAIAKFRLDVIWADRQYIGVDEDEATVRHFLECQDEEDETVTLRSEDTGILFNPSWEDEDMVQLISDSLTLDRLEVRRRLVKAGILQDDAPSHT